MDLLFSDDLSFMFDPNTDVRIILKYFSRINSSSMLT